MTRTSLIVGWWLGVTTSVALCSPILNIQPEFSTAAPGDILSLSVNVSDMKDLAAFQFDVTFTRAVLSSLAVDEGPFLSGAGSTFFIAGTIDNLTGLISSTASTLIGPVSGVSGTGPLVMLRFKDIAPGPARVDLSNVLLLNSVGTAIAAITQGAVVNSPEPTYTFLIGLLLLGPALFRHLRSRRARLG